MIWAALAMTIFAYPQPGIEDRAPPPVGQVSGPGSGYHSGQSGPSGPPSERR